MDHSSLYFDLLSSSVIEDLCARDDFKELDRPQQVVVMDLVRDKLLQLIIGKVDKPCKCFACTKRDKLSEVLELVNKGMTNVAIAKEMGISESTVRRLKVSSNA